MMYEDEIGEMPIMVSTPLYGHSPLYSLLRERFIHRNWAWEMPVQICEVCGCLHRSWFLYVCYSCSDALQKVQREYTIAAFEKLAYVGVSRGVAAAIAASEFERAARLLSEKAIVLNAPGGSIESISEVFNLLASTQDEPTICPKPRGPEKRGKWWDRRSQRY